MEETQLRTAVVADTAVLRALIDTSVRGLQIADYTPVQIERGLAVVYGVDSQLIADQTYFVIETIADLTIVACGGWSRRGTLCGGDQWLHRSDTFLDPRTDAAKIRAFFVHPAWARRGLGTLMLDACERAARAAGFTRFEMGATRTGVGLYAARGYVVTDETDIDLGGGLKLPIARMQKSTAS